MFFEPFQNVRTTCPMRVGVEPRSRDRDHLAVKTAL